MSERVRMSYGEPIKLTKGVSDNATKYPISYALSQSNKRTGKQRAINILN